MNVTAYELTGVDMHNMDHYIWSEYFQGRDLGHIDEHGNKVPPCFSSCLGDCSILIDELTEHSVIRNPLRPAITIRSTTKGFTVSLGDLRVKAITARAATLPLTITTAFYLWVKELQK